MQNCNGYGYLMIEVLPI